VCLVQYIGEPVEKNVLSWKQLMAVGEEAGPESRMAAKFARNFYEMFSEISSAKCKCFRFFSLVGLKFFSAF
jgi:hypothetical protein